MKKDTVKINNNGILEDVEWHYYCTCSPGSKKIDYYHLVYRRIDQSVDGLCPDCGFYAVKSLKDLRKRSVK